jgi:HK97 family phage portal protein
MEPVQKKDGTLVYEYRPASGEKETLLPEEVHHIRNMSLDGVCGLSTISVWRDVIGYGLILQDYANRFTKNDARPGGLLKFAQTLKPEAKNDLRKQWEEMQGGFSRGRVAVVDGGGDFTPVSASNRDAQFIEARNFNVPQIARLFGLPPTKIGWLEKSSYSNVEELNIATVQDAYLPRAVQREQAIRRDLFTPAERKAGLFAEYDLNALLRGNIENRYKAYAIAIDRGFLVRNEVRRFENWDPLPGLDKPLVPLNMAVVEEDGTIGQSTGQGGAAPSNVPAIRRQHGGPRESLLAVTAAIAMVRSECSALRRANTRESKSSITGWLEDYYAGVPERLVARLGIDGEAARKYSETHRKSAIAAVEGNQLSKAIDGWEKEAAGELAALVLEDA